MAGTLREALRRTPLWPILRPRRTHGYNVGAGRTGTTTLASLFDDAFRSAHEPMAADTVALLRDYWNGEVTEAEAESALRVRDRVRRLEFESSPFLGPFSDLLARAFPAARFFLTVRSPKEWLRSNVDKCVNSPRSELAAHWVTLRDLFYGPPPE